MLIVKRLEFNTFGSMTPFRLFSIVIFLILVPFLADINAQQDIRFRGGLKAGINLAQIDGDMLYGYNRFGYHLGVTGAALLGTKSELQLEFLYGIRGSHYGNRDADMLAYKLHYLDIPVIFCYKDWFKEEEKANYYKVHFQGGLYVGRLISSSSIDLSQLHEKFVKTDLGWLLGVTYYFNVHWGFSGRFTQSVIPLTKYINVQGEETKMISYFISLGLTYRFN